MENIQVGRQVHQTADQQAVGKPSEQLISAVRSDGSRQVGPNPLNIWVAEESESWTVNKADCRRIEAFELWCWRRLLRVPWTAWRSNLSILKEINSECSLEGQILKLRLQYEGSLDKTLMLGKHEGKRRRG